MRGHTACNFDPNALNDDGTCDSCYGCTDATACNYDANATIDDAVVCRRPDLHDGPSDRQLRQRDELTLTDASGADVGLRLCQQHRLHGHGTAVLRVLHHGQRLYGDGICCSFGNGSYSFCVNGEVVASGGSFNNSDVTSFCVEPSTIGAVPTQRRATTTPTPMWTTAPAPKPTRAVCAVDPGRSTSAAAPTSPPVTATATNAARRPRRAVECAADADGDGICDDVDDCVGQVDALGVCNGDCASDADGDAL